MGVIVRVTGVAAVTDGETGKPLTDPKRAAKVGRLRHTDDSISEYFDADLADLGITGGDVRLALDPSGKKFLVMSTFKAPRKLTRPELARLVEETTGQWSDGIGEGCFDLAAADLNVTIDLLQRGGRRPRVEQVDDGKPVKARRPPGAAARRVEEFVKAADAGELGRVVELLAAGVPPDGRNKNGVTALHCAAAEGRVAVVEALLAAGADANLVATRRGETALVFAAEYADRSKDQNVPVAKILLAAGADPNLVSDKPDGTSALSAAVLRHAHELVRVLLAAGADPNVADPECDIGSDPAGMTPLMRVCDPAMARLLLASGADPTVRSDHPDWPTAALYVRMIADANGPESELGRNCLAAAELIERQERRYSK